MKTSPTVLARYESKSRPGSFHEVRRGADGVVYCICPSWRFQKNSPTNRTCKHVEQWKSETKVGGGRSLLDVLGAGPVAVRAPRKPRAAQPVPIALSDYDAAPDTVRTPPPVFSTEEFAEPEWDFGSPEPVLKSA